MIFFAAFKYIWCAVRLRGPWMFYERGCSSVRNWNRIILSLSLHGPISCCFLKMSSCRGPPHINTDMVRLGDTVQHRNGRCEEYICNKKAFCVCFQYKNPLSWLHDVSLWFITYILGIIEYSKFRKKHDYTSLVTRILVSKGPDTKAETIKYYIRKRYSNVLTFPPE